jgi:hypothetical protein
MTQLLIPVHVGSESPERWDEVEAMQRKAGDDAAPYLRDKRRPAVASAELDWTAFGLAPRWIGSDTADRVAALQPSIYSGRGADEFNRFWQGAVSRSETALVISPVGDLNEESSSVRNVFGPPVASVLVGQAFTSINGRLLGKESRVRIASHLGDGDGDLARRLLSCKPAPRWRSLSLSGTVLESTYGGEQYAPEGTLVPILETELGEPVVAVWLSPDGIQRRYIVPVETPWPSLLQWSQEQAFPEFVPGAMRRARRQLGTDVFLMSRAERTARTALAELEADYKARGGTLERQLEGAQTEASTVREGLLYGSGQQLVDAVRAVLESAGVTVVDLDEMLGGTKNADLLCTRGANARLVEVKSASGGASERLYQDLLRHLREWASLPGSTTIDGGALVINHEYRSIPADRSRQPYSRPEFLAAQAEPVVPTLTLFDAWREEDAEDIRRLLFGRVLERPMQPPDSAATQPSTVEQHTPELARRRWFGRR